MDIQNITNPSTTHAQVAVEAYVKYGSCQFHSNDKENGALTNATNGNGVFSGKFIAYRIQRLSRVSGQQIRRYNLMLEDQTCW